MKEFETLIFEDELTEDELVEMLDQAMEECKNGQYITLEEFAKQYGLEP